MLVLFSKGTLSANFDLHDCDERGTGKSMSCFIAPVRKGTESSLPLRRCAWYIRSSSHVSLRCSVICRICRSHCHQSCPFIPPLLCASPSAIALTCASMMTSVSSSSASFLFRRRLSCTIPIIPAICFIMYSPLACRAIICMSGLFICSPRFSALSAL